MQLMNTRLHQKQRSRPQPPTKGKTGERPPLTRPPLTRSAAHKTATILKALWITTARCMPPIRRVLDASASAERRDHFHGVGRPETQGPFIAAIPARFYPQAVPHGSGCVRPRI